MSLTELKGNVDADAALHLPDLIYDVSSESHSLRFEPILLSTLLGEEEQDVVGAAIERDRDTDTKREDKYIFTRWSRSQLLSLLGTKEKWFSLVGLERQADELNARLHGLSNYNFRTQSAADDVFPAKLIRGLVSREYADIPNTEIMKAVVETIPDTSMALRYASGITDRAFYAYIVSPTPITIPNTKFFAYPGAVVKNSEVGYTSLWVIPSLIVRAYGVPVVIESQAVLRRIHRGKVDLPAKFKEAFEKCAASWTDMATKIPMLASKSYLNDDDAVASMERLLASCLSRKDFIDLCRDTYRSQNRSHTALDIFETITEACASYTNRDESYEVGAIAGAVLYRLVF
jgi:hypothetical protein